MLYSRYSFRNTLTAFAVVLCVFLLSFASGGAAQVRAASPVSFDSTNVLDDLQSSEDFDIRRYPYDSTGLIEHPEIFTVVEYAYTFRAADRSAYGLYVYFYNPQALNIVTSGKQNRLMLGVAWETRADGTVVVTDYEKFDLQFCSKSEGDYKDLFYKFKVVDHKSADGKTVAERVNSNARRYDISEIELLTYGDSHATAYPVGGTYIFTGYAEGCGSDTTAASTLDCAASKLETVELELNSSVYRTDSSSLGKDHQHQINSVYFSVPNSLLNNYGALQKIKAEWWEYKTAPILVSESADVVSNLTPHVGRNIEQYNPDVFTLEYGRYANSASSYCDWAYNFHDISSSTFASICADPCTLLPFLFSTDGLSISDYYLSSPILIKYISEYDKSAYKGYLPIRNGDISADLFSDTVDEGRTRGYNCLEMDASETFDLLSYNENHGFWDKVADYGFISALLGATPSDKNVYGIDPIYAVKDTDLLYIDSIISQKLFIDVNDVPSFRQFYSGSLLSERTVFLFRFAATDYFSGFLSVDKHDSHQLDTDSTYIARETVFLDFDVIQLTFRKNDVYTVIPVVASPIDIVGGITPPKTFDISLLWKIILGIIVFLLLVLLIVFLFPVLWPIITFLVKGLVWLICLPYKGIKRLVEHIRAKRGKS